MPKLRISDPNLLAFCKSLCEMTAEHPALKFDLSNPAHCGLVRMLDVKLKKTGETFPDDRAFSVYEQNGMNNPFEVQEKYAMMPTNNDGSYTHPAPDGDETDIAWMGGNQKGIKVEDDTVTTDLSEEQLNRLFQAAKSGRLYAVKPGHALAEFGFEGGYQIRANENGSVTLVGDLNLNESDITTMDRSTRAMFEFTTAMSEYLTSLKSKDTDDTELYDDKQAAETEKQFFWSARYFGNPDVDKNDMMRAIVVSADQSTGVYSYTYEDLIRYTVVENGQIKPLVDTASLDRFVKSDPAYASRYLQAKIADALLDEKSVYFKDSRTGSVLSCREKNGFIKGKNVDRSIEGVEKPSFYTWKRIVHFFSSSRYPEVEAYQKRLEAEKVKAYYVQHEAQINETIDRHNTIKKQTESETKEAVAKYKENHPSVNVQPRKEVTYDHLIKPDALTDQIKAYEEKYGQLPEDFKDKMSELGGAAYDAEETMRANAMCEQAFKADHEIKTILSYLTAAKAMESGRLSQTMIDMITEDRIGDVIGRDKNLTYITERGHSGSFYMENLMTSEKMNDCVGKIITTTERIEKMNEYSKELEDVNELELSAESKKPITQEEIKAHVPQ